MSESRLPPLLDRLAAFLAVFGIVLRWAAGGTGPGTNLFIHLLFWAAPALWFAARAFEGGATWRFSGVEFALLAFVIVSLVSVQRASYKLPALDRALAFLSFALLFVYLANAVGRETLLGLVAPTLAALSIYAILQYLWYFPDILRTYDPAVHPPLTEELRWRIESREPPATFLNPNQFGAFLALGLPILAGSLLESKARLFKGVALALGIVALALTGSLGAWIALGAGAAAFAGLWLTRERHRARAVGAGLAAAGALVVLLLFTPLLSKLGEKSHSMHVRRVYWQAASRMIAEAPVLGVGLDNYQEHYWRVKPEAQQEARQAHNDYLQILAETGIAGFLAFAALLALGLRRALASREEPASDSSPPPPWLVPAAAGSALLGAWLVAGTESWVAALILTSAWIGGHLLERRGGPVTIGPATRIGAAAGLVALLVHMGVDFDLYDPGTALALFVALALVTMLQGGSAPVRLPGAVCAAASAILFAIVLPLVAIVTPRALAADSETEQATLALRRLGALPRQAINAHELLNEARHQALAAQAHNPFLAEAYEVLALAEEKGWKLAPKIDAEFLRLQEREETASQSLENAIALRPRSAPLHALKARMHRDFRKAYLARPSGGPMGDRRGHEHLRLAILHQERAVELYPTYAPYRYALGRLLDDDGRPAEAHGQYREALRLSDLAARERYPLERLQVAPLGRARALARLGLRKEALEILARTQPSSEERADEMDDFLRPLYDEAKSTQRTP